MRQLTKIEIKRKSELNPQLQLVAERARQIQDFFYVCGGRNKIDQEYAFLHGFSKVHYPNSKHNKSVNPQYLSDAVDVAPFANGQIQWNDKATYLLIYKAFQQAAIELKIPIRSGADFNRDGILTNDPWVDLPHHELA